MTSKNTIFLYVNNVEASVNFYKNILNSEPVEQSKMFAFFILQSGLALAIWDRTEIKPTPSSLSGSFELGFKVDDAKEIDTIHADWQNKGVPMILPPIDLDFGRSFIAVDPDGHRLRVYSIGE